MTKPWIIQDWAGNVLCKARKLYIAPDLAVPMTFDSFEDAEEYLSERLGDEYENERGEYYVMQKG